MSDVDDADGLHAAVVTAGIPVYLPLEERWYARAADEIGVRQFAVQDPDGYLLRVSQDLDTRPDNQPTGSYPRDVSRSRP